MNTEAGTATMELACHNPAQASSTLFRGMTDQCLAAHNPTMGPLLKEPEDPKEMELDEQKRKRLRFNGKVRRWPRKSGNWAKPCSSFQWQ